MSKQMLINFNIPNEMRSRFDEVCVAGGRTRTSVLIELIQSYIQHHEMTNSQTMDRYLRGDRSQRKNRRLKTFKEFLADQLPKRHNADQNRPESALWRSIRSVSNRQER